MSRVAPSGRSQRADSSANRLNEARRRLPGMPRILTSGTRTLLERREHALAGRLAVEELVGLGGLAEAEAVGEQPPERDLPVGHETRALPLTHAAEGPRGDQGELLADEVAADVEGRGAALAHEAHPAPGGRALHRGHPRLGQPGAVHGGLRALAVSQ